MCSHTVELLFLPSGAYGEFLLRSDDGQLRYLYAINDQAYKEVDNFIGEIDGDEAGSRSRALKLQQIFGMVACDRTSEGLPLSMRMLPLCPRCDGSRLAFKCIKDPLEVIDVHVHAVSHSVWTPLSEESKRSVVKGALLNAPGEPPKLS